MRWWRLAPVGILTLGCSGLLAPDEAALQGKQDEQDPAEVARRGGDFAGAEGILNDRLKKDPKDAHSWRLLGDVNLTRGQAFHERWKENLGWAVDDYVRAVTIEPANCVSWGRLAAAVVSAAENPASQVPRDKLDPLPLDAARVNCSGAAALAIALARRPTDAERSSVATRLNADPDGPDVLAVAAPWIADAAHHLDLGPTPWKAWGPAAELASGAPFVVLTVPTNGSSVDGSEPRRFTYPEWITAKSVSADRIVYVDRRFPSTIPEKAYTRAPGCGCTQWVLQGPDRIAVGTCGTGPQDRRASELYDPAILKPAGVAHFHEPSISLAVIPWDTVADKSVTCRGGPVGRMFVDTPSCEVSYDRAVPQTRSIPASSGLAVWNADQAVNLVFLARAGKLLGDDVAAHLGRGEVGEGLPYSWFALTQPELPGCKGRGVFQKLQIVDGALEFACDVRGVRYEFRDLTLVRIGAAPAGAAEP